MAQRIMLLSSIVCFLSSVFSQVFEMSMSPHGLTSYDHKKMDLTGKWQVSSKERGVCKLKSLFKEVLKQAFPWRALCPVELLLH